MQYDNKKLYQWIEECNQYDLQQFTPFVVADIIIGYVHKDNLDCFTLYPELTVCSDKITFTDKQLDFKQRSGVMNKIAQDLYKRKKLKSWVGEQYDVATSYGGKVLFTIERAAATLLGIQKYGVHINGYIIKNGQYFMWIAKRATDKPTWPGRLDHLVAGGHASGISVHSTMLKECQEEAGISESLSQQAISVGVVNYNQQVDKKLSRDVLFVYDLQLEENFLPVNTDGEVEAFYLWPIERVLHTVDSSREFKTNCNLVIIDFAVRHGFIQPGEPMYTQIANGLQQKFVF